MTECPVCLSGKVPVKKNYDDFGRKLEHTHNALEIKIALFEFDENGLPPVSYPEMPGIITIFNHDGREAITANFLKILIEMGKHVYYRAESGASSNLTSFTIYTDKLDEDEVKLRKLEKVGANFLVPIPPFQEHRRRLEDFEDKKFFLWRWLGFK